MKLSTAFGLLTTALAVVASPSELNINHIAELEARAGSATGCVQAHCTLIQETTLTNRVIQYEIYWNNEYLFQSVVSPVALLFIRLELM